MGLLGKRIQGIHWLCVCVCVRVRNSEGLPIAIKKDIRFSSYCQGVAPIYQKQGTEYGVAEVQNTCGDTI